MHTAHQNQASKANNQRAKRNTKSQKQSNQHQLEHGQKQNNKEQKTKPRWASTAQTKRKHSNKHTKGQLQRPGCWRADKRKQTLSFYNNSGGFIQHPASVLSLSLCLDLSVQSPSNKVISFLSLVPLPLHQILLPSLCFTRPFLPLLASFFPPLPPPLLLPSASLAFLLCLLCGVGSSCPLFFQKID